MTQATNTKTATITTTTTDTGLTLTFAHGPVLTLTLAELGTEIVNQAILHGLKQKLVDAAAISRNTDTGRSATAEDKFNAVKEVYDRLLAGHWNKPKSEGAGESAGGLLVRALARIYPTKTAETIKTYLAGLSDEQKAALRKQPKVAAMIQTIKDEKVKTDGIDADELLAGLE